MPAGLKEQLGLGEPEARQSTRQADAFKTEFRRRLSPINQCLQYMAVYGAPAVHQSGESKREKICSAYQAALRKVDPTEPSVARNAIQKVLAAADGVQNAVQDLKQAAENAYEAWIARAPELEAVVLQVGEMTDWGFDKAPALQSVIDMVSAKEKSRHYQDARQTFAQFLDKFHGNYDEFVAQRSAQQQCEVRLAAVDPMLAEAAECEFAILAPGLEKLTAVNSAMRDQTATKDYVAALETLSGLEQLVAEQLEAAATLRELRAEYETARAALALRMDQAADPIPPGLKEIDRQIAELTAQVDAAANTEQFDEALSLLAGLNARIDEKLAFIAALQVAKQEYETGVSSLVPRLEHAAQTDFDELASVDLAISETKSQMEAAFDCGQYDEALREMSKLTSMLDKRETEAEQLEARQHELQCARDELVQISARLFAITEELQIQ